MGFPAPLESIFVQDDGTMPEASANRPMDAWLDFNMGALFGNDWADMKADILNGSQV